MGPKQDSNIITVLIPGINGSLTLQSQVSSLYFLGSSWGLVGAIWCPYIIFNGKAKIIGRAITLPKPTGGYLYVYYNLFVHRCKWILQVHNFSTIKHENMI